MPCADTLRPRNFSLLEWERPVPTIDGVLYWHLVNHTPDIPIERQIRSFERAFEVWQIAFDKVPPVGRYIKLKTTSDFHKAHIKLFFMEAKRRTQVYGISDGSTYTLLNKWPFSGKGDVLAHRPPHLGQIHFDESEDWSVMHSPESISLLATTIHELGHVWNIGHNRTFPKSVMGSEYQGDSITLHEDDQRALNAEWTTDKYKIFNGDKPQRRRRCRLFRKRKNDTNQQA